MLKDTAGVAVALIALTVAAIDAQDIVYRSFDSDQQGLPGVEGPEFGVIALDPMSVGRPVLNKPYSAEAVTEVTQTLADGNRIEQRTSARVARDSRGRTRREQYGLALGQFVTPSEEPIVTITDPTTGVHITLNFVDRVAFRAKPARVKLTDEEINASGAVVFGFPPTAATPAPKRGGGGLPKSDARAVPPDLFEVDVFDAAVPAPAPASDAGAFAGVPFNGAIQSETLEARMIEGVRAEGTKTTMSIPAGAIGNSLPLEIVSERWYSPELGIVLLTRRVHPRFGETVYRVINIDRTEPESDLFKVPSGFRVKDVPFGKLTPVKPEEQ